MCVSMSPLTMFRFSTAITTSDTSSFTSRLNFFSQLVHIPVIKGTAYLCTMLQNLDHLYNFCGYSPEPTWISLPVALKSSSDMRLSTPVCLGKLFFMPRNFFRYSTSRIGTSTPSNTKLRTMVRTNSNFFYVVWRFKHTSTRQY